MNVPFCAETGKSERFILRKGRKNVNVPFYFYRERSILCKKEKNIPFRAEKFFEKMKKNS